MKTHPFKPLILGTTKKLLVGTLPPEDVTFYFSNSNNTRLWDILAALNSNSRIVGKGGNALSAVEKTKILTNLNLGISDIIYEYEREEYHSTKDKHICPIKYSDLLQLAVDNEIDELLFVYQSAFKWFNHSLQKETPVRLSKLDRLKQKYLIGFQSDIFFKNKKVKCVLLPSPLNRGTKGQTLEFKLDFYRTHIL